MLLVTCREMSIFTDQILFTTPGRSLPNLIRNHNQNTVWTIAGIQNRLPICVMSASTQTNVPAKVTFS